ncbi:GMC oxidoreductase [Kytococcus sp. Marseille-QA3725]
MHARRRSVLAGAGAALAAAAVHPLTPATASGSRRIAVVGSGYGGAVAALALTSRGIPVDLIEMGCDWDALGPGPKDRVFDPMTDPTARSMWFEERTDMPISRLFGMDVVNRDIEPGAGVLALERFADMKVYVGRGVGGGSLANGGMAVTPDRSFFEQVLPQVDAEEMYSTYFPRANDRLGVTEPAADMVAYSPWYQFTRAGVTLARNAGLEAVRVPNVYDWEHMRRESYREAERSALAQEVIFGNNHGKKALTRTYLEKALATGLVNLTPLTEVTRIRQETDGSWGLDLRTIDFDGVVQSERQATYDRVVLAAGSVGTSKLLVQARSRGDVPGLNEHVGRSWGPNGNTMLALRTEGAGAHQSGIPTMGIKHWDDGPSSVFAEIAPLPAGIEIARALFLAITNNPNTASFTAGDDGTVDLDWTPAKHEPSVAAARAVFDRINEANGTSYATDMFLDDKAFTDYFTYHPLGGMVLGEATDLNGEVKGAPGLFALDGSLIPARIGVNPFVTITALAERCMDRLLAAGRFA